jgi:hypothetical protein
MWVLKTHGESFYVHHVTCELPWSTKETPDNPSTKGSIKVKNCLLQIDNENCATIKELTLHDEVRLKNAAKGIKRVIVRYEHIAKLKEKIQQFKIKHGPIKSIGGACSSTFYMTDIMNLKEFTMLALAMSDTTFRELMPNEGYYKLYDDPKYHAVSDIDLDVADWDDDDDEVDN